MITRFPILYKINKKDKTQQWEIVVSGNMYYTTEGEVGGKLTSTLPTICNSKRGTDPEAQAVKEANAKITQKIKAGYAENVKNAVKFFEPMLAKKFETYEKLLFTVPTFIQPKLDGIRCISEKNTLMSRTGKPIEAAPHLFQYRYLFDGELYNHTLKDDFNTIVSLVKKKKLTERDLNLSKDNIQFHCYDNPGCEGVFSERYNSLKAIFAESPFLTTVGYVLVPTYQVTTKEEIEDYHGQFLAAGYEGSIIRLDLGNYENSRSSQLLKKKDWQDDEFEIIDGIEGIGNRTATIGKFKLKTKEGKEFYSNVKGDFTLLRTIWIKYTDNPEEYIGKKATVKFFNYTPDGIPRFGTIIKIDRDEYE